MPPFARGSGRRRDRGHGRRRVGTGERARCRRRWCRRDRVRGEASRAGQRARAECDATADRVESGVAVGIPREAQDAGRRIIEEHWGTGVMAPRFGITDPEQREEIARLERLTSSPAEAARPIETFYAIDVRELLPAIKVPTLVTHHVDHPVWPIEGARYLAANIPGARLVEYEGQPFVLGPAGGDDYLDLVQEIVTGARPSPSLDRVLKTVVFTDIVGSTERLTEVGDRRWSQLLDEHDAAVGRARSTATTANVSTPLATGTSPCSTARQRGRVCSLQSSPMHGDSVSTCARACTRVSAKCAVTTTPGWLSTSAARVGALAEPGRGARDVDRARPRRRVGHRVPRARAPRTAGHPRRVDLACSDLRAATRPGARSSSRRRRAARLRRVRSCAGMPRRRTRRQRDRRRHRRPHPRRAQVSEIQPTIGPPIGVLPRNTMAWSASTRPAHLRGGLHWTMAVDAVRKLMLAQPTAMPIGKAIHEVGVAASSSIVTPNAVLENDDGACRGSCAARSRARRGASRR